MTKGSRTNLSHTCADPVMCWQKNVEKQKETETEKDEVLTFYWPVSVLQFYYDTHTHVYHTHTQLYEQARELPQSLMHLNKLLHHNLFVIVVLGGLKQAGSILSQ